MPTITLVAVPRPGATARVNDHIYYLNVPHDEPDEAALASCEGLAALGFIFAVGDVPAPEVPDPPAEQAADPSAPDPAPAQ